MSLSFRTSALGLLLAGLGAVSFAVTPPVEKIDHPELRYRILSQFGRRLFFCDPDLFPLGRSPQLVRESSLQAYPEILQDRDTFDAIAKHLGLKEGSEFSEDNKQALYQEYKKLRWGVQIESLDEKYKFTVSVKSKDGDFRIEGTIDRQGKIEVLNKEATHLVCPMCLARDTRIDTPAGPVAVQDIREGVLVWTLDAKNNRIAMPVLKTAAVTVSAPHWMIHLVLHDGRELWASPAHPAVNGKAIDQLTKSTSYDGTTIDSVEIKPYTDTQTYDLLPAGPTGFYWANGIPVASTLSLQ